MPVPAIHKRASTGNTREGRYREYTRNTSTCNTRECQFLEYTRWPVQGTHGEYQYLELGLAISGKKNYSAEGRIYGSIDLFRRNSGCSAEQKTLGISFRTVPQRRKMLGIPFRGTKIEANSRDSVPKHVSAKNMSLFWLLKQDFFSVNLGMPRNEQFLPRNNVSHSESIPQNFF